MKAKKIMPLLVLSAVFLANITSCAVNSHKNDEQYKIYLLAKDAGYEGTYEEWLASIKGEKGDKGDTGETGPKGDKGDTGETGPKGDKGDTGETGPKGDKGDTGETGPKGDTGETGAAGVGIESVTINDDGELVIVTTDGQTHNLGVVVGEAGPQGPTGETGPQGPTGSEGEVGLSAYEIYITYNPEYPGDETQWLDDLVNGRLGTEEKATVTFKNGDEVVATQEVTKGSPLTKPTSPEKTGYTFKGWADPDGNIWNFYGHVATQDMTLTAVFEINYYTITVSTLGESMYEEYAYGEVIELPDIGEYEGAPFLGWYSDNAADYVEGEYTVTADDTLTATWDGIHQLVVSGPKGETMSIYVSEYNVLDQINNLVGAYDAPAYNFVGYALEDGTLITNETALPETGVVNVSMKYEFAYAGEYQHSDSSSYKLSIDSEGNATIQHSSYTYTGAIEVVSPTEFRCVATNSSDATIDVTMKLEHDGVISVVYDGDRTKQGYYYNKTDVTFFQLGVTYVTNLHNIFVYQDGTYDFFSVPNSTSVGTKVEVSSLNEKTPTEVGAILEITNPENGEVVIAKFSSKSGYGGLVLPTAERGTYSNGDATLTLDGFAKSSSSKGAATIDGVAYDYYLQGTDVCVLSNADTAAFKVILDIENKTYANPSKEGLEGVSFLNTKSIKTNYSSTDSSVYLDVDDYGLGEFSMTSGSSWSSSTYKYAGRVAVNPDGGYVFNGTYTSGSTVKTVSLNLTDLGDGFAAVTSSDLNCVLAPSNVSVKYIYESYGTNIITTMTSGEKVKYLYYASSSSAPVVANVEIISGTNLQTVGTKFKVTVGEETIFPVVMVKSSSQYIGPDASYGEYTVKDEETIITLDGFASLSAGTSGDATVDGATGTYSMITNSIIEVNANDSTTRYTIDVENKTLTKLATVDTGVFAGTYTQVVAGSGTAKTITFSNDGIATYVSGGNTYTGSVVVTDGNFTVDFYRQGQSYSNAYSGYTLESDGSVIVVKDNSDYEYIFVKDADSTSFIGAKSSTSNLLFSVTVGENTKYYYATSNKSFVNTAVNVALATDSPAGVALGGSTSIIEVTNGEEVLMIAKVGSANSTSGFTLANLDERHTLVNGEDTFFTDGFGTTATLAGVSYSSYSYSKEIADTVILTDASGNTTYVTIDILDGSYEVAEAVLEDGHALLNTYKGTSSTSNTITINKYGYGSIKVNNTYNGKFTFNEDKTEFTFKGKYYYYNSYSGSENIYEITATGRVIKDGIIFVQLAGNETKGQYYTTGTSSQYGYAWDEFIYIVTVDDEVTYLYADETVSSNKQYPGEVNVTLISGDEITTGAIVKVTSEDNSIVYFEVVKLNAVNGNSGLVIADAVIGEYALGEETLVLDGFGNATLGEATGTYTVTGTTASITIGDKIYELKDGTVSELSVDQLHNKTASATVTCSCYGSRNDNNNTITFVFDGFGKVKISQACKDANGYTNGSSYHSSTLTNSSATYTIEGTTVTINSNGYNVIFTLDGTTLTCVSTTVSSGTEDHIPTGTTFNIA